MKKSIKIAGNVLFYAGIAAVLIMTLLFATSTNAEKSIFGYRFYEVLSDSMRPDIAKGDLVIIQMIDPEDVQVGDIVTKSLDETGSTTLTHRVIERYEEDGELMFITQGDASPSPDEPISGDAIIGKVVNHIPLLGNVVNFIKEHFILTLLILAALVVIVVALKALFRKDPANPEKEPEKGSADLEKEPEEEQFDTNKKTYV